MRTIILSFCVFIFAPRLCCAEQNRILFLAPFGPKSHKIFYMGIIEILAKRDNHITMVSPFEPSKTIENVREVVVQNHTWNLLLENVFDSNVMGSMFKKSPQMCIDGLRQTQIQDLKKEKYDVIVLSMFFNFCFLSFVYDLKIPYIYISPAGLHGTFNNMVGNIDFPAITGNKLLDFRFPFTFTQRLITTCSNLFISILADYHVIVRTFRLCKDTGLCASDMPDFADMNKNVSLVILNSVRTLEYPPRPTMPNVIYAGGAHIKPPKALAKDLEEWVQGSGEDGFIFFSLGSNLNPSFLPEKYRKILIKVFGSLKQRVLWKWEGDSIPDLPPNIKLQKWLPQPDILGHPKLRIFITHGGLLSTLESTYNGIPLIGMPIFADQFSNMGEVEKDGWGKTVQWTALEEESLRNLIQEVLNSERMREMAQHRSALMKDPLIHPAEEAAYWIEYVIRHRGAPHIASPIYGMKWYEVYNIDVWAFLVSGVVGVLFCSLLVTKTVLRRCFGASESQRPKKKRE